jgi:ChrR Cupin-like domain
MLAPPVGAPAQKTHLIVSAPKKIKWVPAPPSVPLGAQVAVLYGDPGIEDGLFSFRIKFPSGSVIPPHRHSQSEIATVISGTFCLIDQRPLANLHLARGGLE